MYSSGCIRIRILKSIPPNITKAIFYIFNRVWFYIGNWDCSVNTIFSHFFIFKNFHKIFWWFNVIISSEFAMVFFSFGIYGKLDPAPIFSFKCGAHPIQIFTTGRAPVKRLPSYDKNKQVRCCSCQCVKKIKSVFR